MRKDSRRSVSEKRVAAGLRQKAEEAALTAAIPSMGQMMLPLLHAVVEHGGRARPREVYEAVADRLGVSAEVRAHKETFADGTTASLFERQVRWARQTAIMRGYLASPERGVWEITAGGRNALRNVRRGVIITVFENDLGIAVAANIEDAAGLITPESVDLLFTSPPFPLLEDSKGYGTMSSAAWLEWMTGLVADWKGWLAPTGSMVFHLGECGQKGLPVQSLYIERFVIKLVDELGMHLAARHYFENPARLPGLQWAGIRRMRVRTTVEPMLWFSKTPWPKANNRNVLEPYAERTLQRYIGQSFKPVVRPSGERLGETSFSRDNGGRIPGNIIRKVNQPGTDPYHKACKAVGLIRHPAMMPRGVADFFIKLTTDPGDLVVEPFFGSGTTAAAAQALGRRWIGFERSLEYLEGSTVRFVDTPGFKVHGDWRRTAVAPDLR